MKENFPFTYFRVGDYHLLHDQVEIDR